MKRIFTSFFMLLATLATSINVNATIQQAAAAEPTYQIPSDSDNARNRDDRRLKAITITGATKNGEAQPFTFTLKNDPEQPTVYMDETSTVLHATAGDQINVSWTFRTLTEWTHYYLYIDYNHDGVFNEENELVSYTYYSETDADGVNSLGQVVPESQRGVTMDRLPQFQIPEGQSEVTTRMRFKSDWNSKNPLGNPTQSIGANGGTMVDFTLVIHAKQPAVTQFPVTLKQAVNGSYTVKDVDGQVITDGMEVAEGTELTVEAVANEGYEVDQILVNGQPLAAGAKVVVSAATTIEVTFRESVKMWTVNINATEGGTVELVDANAKRYQNGSQIVDGTQLEGIQIHLDPDSKLVSLKVNDVEHVSEVVALPNFSILMYSEPVQGDINISAKFSVVSGIGEAALVEAAYSAEAQSLNIPAGAYAVVYNAAGQQVMHVQGDQIVSTSSLAQGAYLVRVVAEGNIKVIKFVQK